MAFLRWRQWSLIVTLLAAWCSTIPAAAVTIKIDYTFDTGNFFGSGNPQGASAGVQAKAALEAAAGLFSSILGNSFSAITVPEPFHSTTFDGEVTWQWTRNFNHPTNNNPIVLTHAMPGTTIAANDYVVFVGARNIPGSTVGIGGPGGYSWSSHPTGGFTSAEISLIDSITDTFQGQVERRGQFPGSGFARWGGTISFDTSPSAPWHYNHTVKPAGNVIDFYSVAIHELGHALGFGASSDWQDLVSGTTFIGQNSMDWNGGAPVPLSANLGHWAQTTESVVYGTTAAQQPAMTPSLTNGTRKHLTELDVAGLSDIGWQTLALPTLFGDYTNDGIVDASDYAIWRKYLGQNVILPNDATPGTVRASDYNVWRSNFGKSHFAAASSAVLVNTPEPGTAFLALIGWFLFFGAHRKRSG